VAGKKFAAVREKLTLTQQEFAQRVEMSIANVRRIEGERTTSIRPEYFRNLANLLEISHERLTEILRPSNGDALPPGVSPNADTLPIPEWDIDLRASAWADVPVARLDTDNPEQQAAIAAGRFRLRIIGTCMEPEYLDGQTVEFQIVRADAEPLEPGRDYAVCRSDGTATFKRLVRVDEEVLVLAALNRREYPDRITVPRQEVCRVAKVLYRLTPPPPVKVPKG